MNAIQAAGVNPHTCTSIVAIAPSAVVVAAAPTTWVWTRQRS